MLLLTVAPGKVVFKPFNEEEFDYDSDSRSLQRKVILSMKAKKLLARRCMGYLATVVDTKKVERMKPKDVPVVRDFINVFLEDLPGLPWIEQSLLKLNYFQELYQY